MNNPQETEQEANSLLDRAVQDAHQNVLQTKHAVHLDGEQLVDIKIDDYRIYLEELRKNGQSLRADIDQPKLIIKPSWFKEHLFKNAQSVYERHFMGINFAHLSGLLMLVRVDSIYRTLNATDQSSTVAKLFKRYYHTVRHVKCWYEGDIFDEQNEAYRSLLTVRGMHNKVSTKFNGDCPYTETIRTCSDDNNQENRPAETGSSETSAIVNDHKSTSDKIEDGAKSTMMHISEYDIMLTQFAFAGFIVMNAKKMGLLDDFNDEDMESLLHFWRVIGYYLGASDKYNLFAYEMKDIVGLCDAIRELEYKQSIVKNSLSSPPGIMSLNIIRSVKFIPMLTIYGMIRYLYEIIGQETGEVEHKRNWYSNLSYTLINIVMTRFLAYKPLRSFNNGLTRLSLYLVGKVEDWFSSKLDRKYGHVLRA